MYPCSDSHIILLFRECSKDCRKMGTSPFMMLLSFQTSFISSIPLLIASSFIGIKWW